MSGIARNALRLIGTTKFVTNNATNYLRSSWNMGNRFNLTKNESSGYWKSISTDENTKAFSIENLSNEDEESPIGKLASRKMGNFHVTIENGDLEIETPEEVSTFTYFLDIDNYISKELIETILEDEYVIDDTPVLTKMIEEKVDNFQLLFNTDNNEIILTTPAGDKSIVFNQRLQFGVYKESDENLPNEINNDEETDPKKKPLSIQSGKFNLLLHDCEIVTFDREGPQNQRKRHELLYDQFGEKIPNEFNPTPLILSLNECNSHKVFFNSGKILVKTQESDEIFYYKYSIDMEFRSHKILTENLPNKTIPFNLNFNVGNLFLKTQKDDETYAFNHEVLFKFQESDNAELIPYIYIEPFFNRIQN